MFSVKEIVEATQGKLLCGNINAQVRGVCTDSRLIKKTDCFVALKGERFDGHDFIDQLIKKKVKTLVVSKTVKCLAGINVIEVKDTTKALGYIANYHRRQFSIPVIAITGSAGKTSTKEMIADVLSAKYKVLKNYKNENNQFGVPYTLLRLNSTHQVAVVEVGTNQFGDIPWLARVVEPTIAVFTNIGASHLEKLKTLEGVFREKFSLTDFMRTNNVIVYNSDDKILKRIANKKDFLKKISYGIQSKSKLKALGVEIVNHKETRFCVGKENYQIPFLGKQHVYNVLAAIACAKELNVSNHKIKKALSSLKSISSRQNIFFIKGRLIIDDTYNANPVSFKSAIEVFDQISVQGKKILVCADMLELGSQAKQCHQDVGDFVGRSKVDVVFSFGENAGRLARRAKKINPEIEAFKIDSIEELNQKVLNNLNPRDAVLIKASRGMHLERVVDFLKKELK